MGQGFGDVLRLRAVAHAEGVQVLLVVLEEGVKLCPVLMLCGGDGLCAGVAHGGVERFVVCGVVLHARGDARQHFAGRGFVSGVAQACGMRRQGQAFHLHGQVAIGNHAAPQAGGKVGAAAPSLQAADDGECLGVQGRGCGVVLAVCGECGKGGDGNGGGAAQPQGGVDGGCDGQVQCAACRIAFQAGEHEAQARVGMQQSGRGAVFAEGAVYVYVSVVGGGEGDVYPRVNGADDGRMAVHDGMFAADHERAGGAGGNHGFLRVLPRVMKMTPESITAMAMKSLAMMRSLASVMPSRTAITGLM